MTKPIIQEFPYLVASTRLFDSLAHRPWAAYLDSGFPASDQGRFDILTSDPAVVLVTRGEQTEIRDAQGARISSDEPFRLLRSALGPNTGVSGELPFYGGAVGYFGYDLGRRLERLPSTAEDLENLPEMAVGIYDWALVVDHYERRSWLVGRSVTRIERFGQLLRAAVGQKPADSTARYRVLDAVSSNMSKTEYLTSLARIKRYIRDGDCYQVNFAQRFAARAEGDLWCAYQRLRQVNAAPFGAYLNTPHCRVLSSSPERFLRLRRGVVETKPIKGTVRRGKNSAEDRMLAEALLSSGKNQAENLMIVDLLRNDLGKVCALGSIQVTELFALESYARVHHLVSTVRGRLADGEDAISLLRACFPGGSITGAPKLRAMEIIEELEPHRRGIYCGAIGYVGFNGDMDSSIAIRTMVHSAGVTRLWAGGGIVADSDPEAEYRETYHKAEALLEVLRQFY